MNSKQRKSPLLHFLSTAVNIFYKIIEKFVEQRHLPRVKIVINMVWNLQITPF